MTREEAIRRIKDHIKVHHIGEYPHIRIAEALNMAIAALRAQQEAEKNEPLTLEELREMEGEPVWLNIAGGVWGLVDTDDDVVWLDRGGSIDIRLLAGKAYRHKPKEDAT